MSQSVPAVEALAVAAATTEAVKDATTFVALANAAEANPVVKADLQAQYDSYSHSVPIVAIAGVAGMYLAQHNLTVDNTLLTVAVGLAVTGIGYAWQWVSMKVRKPVTATPAA